MAVVGTLAVMVLAEMPASLKLGPPTIMAARLGLAGAYVYVLLYLGTADLPARHHQRERAGAEFPRRFEDRVRYERPLVLAAGAVGFEARPRSRPRARLEPRGQAPIASAGEGHR